MKATLQSLAGHLEKGLRPIYLILTDEPLLLQEATEMIRAAILKSGVEERKSFDDVADFETLGSGMDNLSLFSQQCLYEFHLNKALTQQAGELVIGWCEQQQPEDFIIISMPQGAAKAASGRVWYKKFAKAIDAIGVEVTIWPIKYAELGPWLDQRSSTYGIRLNHEALSVLVERTEGNLLAANQELQRLALAHVGNEIIDAEKMREYSADSARFGPFEMMEVALSGNAFKATRMAQRLREEGDHITEIMGAVSYEVRSLAALSWHLDSGDNLTQVFAKGRVWKAKQGIYAEALKRFGPNVWYRLLQGCLKIDRMSKGGHRGDPWLALETLLLVIAGQKSFAKTMLAL